MSKIVAKTEEQIREIILKAAGKAVAEGKFPSEPLPDFAVEVPADRTHGDFAVNAAMVWARALKSAPRKIAETLLEYADLSGSYIEKIEIAGPGFINMFLSGGYYSAVLKDIRESGGNYGRSDFGSGKKIMVEFVSANPTGPMHMGNARGGALGDCLASVLDYAGYEVAREFYINDAGNQIDKFALSLEVRYLQHFEGEEKHPLPEDCYQGADIKENAAEFAGIYGDRYLTASPEERRRALVEFALPKNIKNMKSIMAKYRIEYDRWFNESILHENGELDETIEILKKNGRTYEKDGALWYKNIEVQTEILKKAGKTQEEIDRLELKDDVLVRANGNPTYFAADIAYHRNKLEIRGFDKAIDVWGADHHGHVARMKGALEAIGIDGDRLDVILMQLVRLVKDGEVVRMSKRTGRAITLTDLLDDIPTSAARFLFNMREAGSQMDFDLDLAVEQSSQNPVYYCQYAHARICSIIKKLKNEGTDPRECSSDELDLLKESEERELIRHLSSFTGEIVSAAKKYDPASITRYVIELATLFHKFYNTCKVNVDDESLMQARLYLCICVRDVIKLALSLLKIEAPEVM